MGEKKIIKVPINKRKIITIPDKIMELLGAKIGDELVFKIENDFIRIGLVKKTIIEENISFKIKK